MTRTIRLNDLQMILLSHAASHDNGSLVPYPESIVGETERIGRAIPALIKRGLVEETPISDRRLAWRGEGEEPIGIRITPAGRAAIGIEPEDEPSEDGETAEDIPQSAAPSSAPRAGSKAQTVLNLLSREEGATIADLIEATGWLPHTTRAALTGLRKKGRTIEKSKRDDVTCYRIAEAG